MLGFEHLRVQTSSPQIRESDQGEAAFIDLCCLTTVPDLRSTGLHGRESKSK